MTRAARAVALALSIAAVFGASAAPSKRVLVLQSYGRGFEPYETIASSFRSELVSLSSGPVEFHEVALDAPLFAGAEGEQPLVAYLQALDASHGIDLVVAVGGLATRFVQRHRDQVLPTTDLLIAGVDVRHITEQGLTERDSVVASRLGLDGAIGNIFRLLPETKGIAVVLGTSPLERFWREEIRREFQPFASRARMTFLDELPFEEILKLAEAAGDGTAILYAMYAIDTEGVSHTDDKAMAALTAVARVPVFGLFDFQLGKGIVGGALVSPHDTGDAAAAIAARLLRGDAPSPQRPPPIGPGVPTYDWRQLARFGIPTSRLPSGSVLLFRPPGFWEANRWTILWIALIGGVEAALIVVLLANLRGRRVAEENLRRSREQFALAVDGANDGLWDWNLRTGEVYYSERCKSMLGHQDEEVPNQYASWEQRIHAEDRERVSLAIRSHLDGRTPAFHVEHRLRHKDGSYRWILARGKALRNTRGEPYRMAGSLSDITDLKQAEEGMRDVSGRMILAQEEERARLARELHDDVTQRLARLAIDVGRLEHGDPTIPTGETMRRLREELTRLSEDVHALSYRLHPSLLEDLGLADALQVECERFSGASRIPARLDAQQLGGPVPRGLAICLYRVAQEALRNIERHAHARTVQVTLRAVDEGIQLAVHDDGVGFDPSSGQGGRSLGHTNMRERVRLAGGEIDIESVPGHGTTIVAWVPLRRDAA